MAREAEMAFTLTSPAFDDGASIPQRHARSGENLSPQLDWTDPPAGTASFALVMEDPDASSAPAFRHWLVYDIPRDRRHLAPGGSSAASTEGLPHAFNDFGNARYDGPQPPPDDPPHRYRFRLAALNVERLDLPGGAAAGDAWEAARPHIVAQAELVGTFQGRP
jgi:Raf kinase inhibitor-like YbhB/YbcL family protein